MFSISVNNVAKVLADLKRDYLSDIDSKVETKVKLLNTKLIENTPIDTGYAKSRWIYRKIGSMKYEVKNDAEYLPYLNRGSSKQAPAYFIEKTALAYGKPAGVIVKETT